MGVPWFGMRSGSAAPEFSLPDRAGELHSLGRYRGRWVVLYFYPRDDTPGCTEEACRFRDQAPDLEALGVQVLGVSPDNAASHAAFAGRYGLDFPLLADTHRVVARQYGVLKGFGLRKGYKRRTFLIDPDGLLVRVYRRVDPGLHSAEVVAEISRLQGQALR